MKYMHIMKNLWIVILICHVYSVSAKCSDGDPHVFRICENNTSNFMSAEGEMRIEPEDIKKMKVCACSIRSVSGRTNLKMLNLAESPNLDTGTNISITHGNQTIPITVRITIPQIQGDVTLKFQHFGDGGHDHNTYCYFFQTKSTKGVSLNCSVSFRSDAPVDSNSDSSVSIGAILGPTITVFILFDIAAIGLVYYIMKRRMRRTWRSSISDRRDEPKDNGSDRPRGNNYVGIRTQSSADERYIQAVGEEYEEVGQQRIEPRQAPGEVPQKKKAWFNFGRNQDVVTKQQVTQPGSEYEEVPEPPQKAIPKLPKVCPRTPVGSAEVDWTPADEYEEVEVSEPSSSLKKGTELAKVQVKTPRSWTRNSKKLPKEEDLQPKECYEEMNPVSSGTKGKLTRNASSAVKRELIEQAVNKRKTASPVLAKASGSTEGNITPTQKMKRPKPAVSPKPTASNQPTDVYDNAEMFPEPPKEKRPNHQRKPLVPKRVRTVTDPPNPNQIYDNFDRILEVENKSRAGSVKK